MWVSMIGKNSGKLLTNNGWEGGKGLDERGALRALTRQSMTLSSLAGL